MPIVDHVIWQGHTLCACTNMLEITISYAVQAHPEDARA